MKSERRDEITGLELPRWKRTIDDFKPQRQPVYACERSSSIEFAYDWLFQTENDLPFDLQRTGMCNRKRSGVAGGVLDGVVVHMRPNQRLEFECTPHCLVRITNFAANCFVSNSFAELPKLRFNFVGCVEIESGTTRQWDHDHSARLVRGKQLSRPSVYFKVVGHEL